VIAEVALKRGDCRAASEAYAHGAAVAADVQLARRATQVAMACEHLPAAWAAATRWRTLAPGDREADALYAAVALKLYHTSEARAAIHDFWRAEEHAGVDAAAAGGVRCACRVDGHERGAGADGELARYTHTVGRTGAGCVRRPACGRICAAGARA